MGRTWLHSRTRVWTAQMCGDDHAMDGGAGTVLRSVRRVASRHVDTGNYMSKLRVVNVPGELGTGRSVRDRLVVADDEAAAAIEWGHIRRFPNSRRVQWVPGLHIMTHGLMGVPTIE